jgi:hypothetical protein
MVNEWRSKRFIFKTSKFTKDSKKARISDAELCEAIHQIAAGQVDNLGGGVFKKRLNNNMYRSILLAKGSHFWIYEYLFAKKDKDNIQDDELAAFRQLVKGYSQLTEQQVKALVDTKYFMEICHDNASSTVQK